MYAIGYFARFEGKSRYPSIGENFCHEINVINEAFLCFSLENSNVTLLHIIYTANLEDLTASVNQSPGKACLPSPGSAPWKYTSCTSSLIYLWAPAWQFKALFQFHKIFLFERQSKHKMWTQWHKSLACYFYCKSLNVLILYSFL